MNNEIIIVLLNEFSDWEGGFIAPALRGGLKEGEKSEFVVKTLSITKDPIISMGGLRVLPDYNLQTLPKDYKGLILIGGLEWFTAEAQLLVPIVSDAIEKGKLVAGICNASVFLGLNGFLNNVKHTSNTLDYLKKCAGEKYTGEKYYQDEQAVRDNNIITANGTAFLEFCREILYALNQDKEGVDRLYNFHKLGLCEIVKQA